VGLDPTVVDALSELRERLERDLPGRLVRLVLFGSTARGEVGEDSDVDVLVLLREPVLYRDRARVMDLFTPIALDRGLIPAAVVLGVDEWDEMKRRELLFVEEVERDGIPA
jgi:predicted nucleotidyltransferase